MGKTSCLRKWMDLKDLFFLEGTIKQKTQGLTDAAKSPHRKTIRRVTSAMARKIGSILADASS